MAVRSLAQSSLRQSPQINSMLASYQASAFHHLETVRLGGNASSVEFTNLARYSDYQHLQIRWASRSSSSTGGVVLAQLNGDTAANYSTHYLVGVPGTGVVSGAVTSTSNMYAGQQEISSAASGAFGAGVIDILDPYETSKNTTLRGLAGATAGQRIILTSGNWRNTNAITSITLFADSGGIFIAGSRFSLYGIKARA